MKMKSKSGKRVYVTLKSPGSKKAVGTTVYDATTKDVLDLLNKATKADSSDHPEPVASAPSASN